MPRLLLGPAAAGRSCWAKLPHDVLGNICSRLTQNEVMALALVERATRAAVAKLGYPSVFRLSLPVPPALFSRCWAAPGAFSRLTVAKRKRLLCLLATSGSLANLQFAAERIGLHQPLTHVGVLCAAAEAGHAALCKELLNAREAAQVGGEGGWGDAAVGEALAAGGLFPTLKQWFEDNSLRGGVSNSRMLVAAAASGHLYQFAWLVRRLGLRRRGLLEAGGGSDGSDTPDTAAAAVPGLSTRPPQGGLLLLRNVLCAAAAAGHAAFVEALLPPYGAAASLLYPLEDQGRRREAVWQQRQWQPQPTAAVLIPELLPELLLVDAYEDEARQAAAAEAAVAVAGLLRAVGGPAAATAAAGGSAAGAGSGAAATAEVPGMAVVSDGGGVVSPAELLLGSVVARDVLAAAAKGCDLKGLQRLHALLGRRAPPRSPALSRIDLLARADEPDAAVLAETREAAAAAVLAGAAGSPTPDWKQKFEWLEAAGNVPPPGPAGRSVRQEVVQAAAGLRLHQRRRGSQHGPECGCEGCGLRRRPEERPSGRKVSAASAAANSAAAGAAAPCPRLESGQEALRRVMWLERRGYRAAPEPQRADGGAKGLDVGSSSGCLAVNQAALAGNLPVLAFFMGPPQSSQRRRPEDKKEPPQDQQRCLAANAPAAERQEGMAEKEPAASKPKGMAPLLPPASLAALYREITPVVELEPQPLALAEPHPLAPAEPQPPKAPQPLQGQQELLQAQPRPQRRRRLLPVSEEQLLRALASGGQLASLRWLHGWAMARGRSCRLHEVLSAGPLVRSLLAAALADAQAETAHWVMSVLLLGKADAPLRPYHPADPDSAATGVTAASMPPASASLGQAPAGGARAGAGARSRRASSTVSLSASLSASFHHLSLSAATDALHRISASSSSSSISSSTHGAHPLAPADESAATTTTTSPAADAARAPTSTQAAPLPSPPPLLATPASSSKPICAQLQEDEHRSARTVAFSAANTEGDRAAEPLDRALSLLRQLHTQGSGLFGEQLMKLAVEGGCVPLARLMRLPEAGFPWDEEDAWTAAANCGSADVLLWLQEVGCKAERSSLPVLAAASNSDLATLQRLRAPPLSYPVDWLRLGGTVADFHGDDTQLQMLLVAEAEAAGAEAEAALQRGLATGLFGIWEDTNAGCGYRAWRGLKRLMCCGGASRRRRSLTRKCLACMQMSALGCLVACCYPCIAAQV
ncbi:hypothetical protein HYH02_005172 [Chlamydomonas schloesseri]|uniref:Uncharacterized protein n=1 Tax=Chlamydomonas schloesseri TaxID=2026947 RepID=A0A835WMZ0_9CHLO|nr:hypothetical protein HYH02_005172 [Chlamydomonas schloesseri]|eukprot:KAG2449640.1 hypothetical protein HYH02_005172 [Chlamydomonas schloesseri]